MGSSESKVQPATPRVTDAERERLRKKQEHFGEEVRRTQKARSDAENEKWKNEEQKLKREKRQAEEARKQAEERAEALQQELARHRDMKSFQEEMLQDLRNLMEIRKTIERDLDRAVEATALAKERLWEGRRHLLVPTQAQYAETRRRLQYEPGYFHFAVSGISGSGKSSLINAFRGLRNSSRKAAPVGVVETTSEVVRYPDTTGKPYAWYDVPGAGTLSIPDWQYFTDQGLYIFDCIIVVFDTRFTATDIAILLNSITFQIPTFIVRSKSRQHIANVAKDLPKDGDGDDIEDDIEDDDTRDTQAKMAKARESYILDTRRSVASELKKADLDSQRVYIIDNDDLLKTVKGKSSDGIDEGDLLRDMFALAARYGPNESSGTTGDGSK